jgi:orotate phosphoribosyltransferase
MIKTALKAVELGLLKIPQEGKFFKSRTGVEKKYLIDARGAGTNLALRKLIITEMENIIKMFPESQAICGIAKSGIMWGSWLSWVLEMPYATVLLDGPRDSGLGRQIEGSIENQKVILIDNWIREGLSMNKAIKILHDNGAIVNGGIVITKINKNDISPNIISLWDLEDLFEAARQIKLVPDNYKFY